MENQSPPGYWAVTFLTHALRPGAQSSTLATPAGRLTICPVNERGELPGGRKFGRRLRFPRPVIKAWLLAD